MNEWRCGQESRFLLLQSYGRCVLVVSNTSRFECPCTVVMAMCFSFPELWDYRREIAKAQVGGGRVKVQ